jgi:hypothetical protein
MTTTVDDVQMRRQLAPGERFEWGEPMPTSFSATRRFGGVWVVSKMGAYADLDALVTKMDELVRHHEVVSGGLMRVQLGLWSPASR